MTNLASKLLLAGAVALLAIAISTPSEAGRKKRTMAAASPACVALTYCSANCANGWCNLYQCGLDGKYYPTVPPVCLQPLCSPPQRKC